MGGLNFFKIDNVWYDSVRIRYLSGIVTVVFWYYTVEASSANINLFIYLRGHVHKPVGISPTVVWVPRLFTQTCTTPVPVPYSAVPYLKSAGV